MRASKPTELARAWTRKAATSSPSRSLQEPPRRRRHRARVQPPAGEVRPRAPVAESGRRIPDVSTKHRRLALKAAGGRPSPVAFLWRRASGRERREVLHHDEISIPPTLGAAVRSCAPKGRCPPRLVGRRAQPRLPPGRRLAGAPLSSPRANEGRWRI